MHEPDQAAAALFAASDPVVSAIYRHVLAALSGVGPFREEAKKASIHLVRTTGFAGVHPRRRSLTLNLRLTEPLSSSRVAKVEQVSKHRYHNEIKLERPEQVDDELIAWLRAAYELGT